MPLSNVYQQAHRRGLAISICVSTKKRSLAILGFRRDSRSLLMLSNLLSHVSEPPMPFCINALTLSSTGLITLLSGAVCSGGASISPRDATGT
jgi:hypothetical protein